MDPTARPDDVPRRRRRISLIRLPRFRSFQSRLLVFFIGLMGLALVSVFVSINAANRRSAQTQIEDNLKVGVRVFKRLIRARVRQLADGARILSTDFAFKRALATGDHDTIVSALENLQARIGADAMMLVSLDYTLMADTTRPEARDEEFFLPELIEAAEETGEAESMVRLLGGVHEMVVAPLLAPDPIAWLCVSFAIDQALVNELQRLTLLHISLFQAKEKTLTGVASTMPRELGGELGRTLRRIEPSADESALVGVGGVTYVTLVTEIFRDSRLTVIAALQRSLEEGLQPFYRFRIILISIAFGGLAISIIGGVLISRTVTKPVLALVTGVREIEKSNYDHTVTVSQRDELGELAGSFNRMSKGLAERDKVRNILGKVVSPDVAAELVKGEEVRLGGEERLMTAFFSDLAGFTSISEKMRPAELVELLNEYLSAMTELIYESGGTVDKFIGDAIVAFWGAPLPEENHAQLCVRAAVRMQKRLAGLRTQWNKEGKPELYMRIGVNTGQMVVGAMGSKDRLDYTMIGDAVNLAARLEGANKYYGSDVMISEFTHAIVKERFLCRELDIVRVQGKEEPIRIFEVIDEIESVTANQRARAERFATAVAAFRSLEFDTADKLFTECDGASGDDGACALYRARIAELALTPPPENWDRVYPLAK